MRDVLDYQADQIERVLETHGAPGRVYGGSVSPRLVEFHVAPAAGVKIARIEGLAEELALYLGVARCRIERRGSVVSIAIPKEHAPVVKLLNLVSSLGRSIPPASAVLGQDSEGVPVLLRLPSPEVAHVLITGTTGSGKTELARSMILSLALCNRPDAVRMVLVDPKSRGYGAFNAIPHLVCPVISDVVDAHHRLEGLVAEMERRDRAAQSEPRVVVFIDELADLMMVGGKQMVQTMTRLTQRGREAGIHIVACTQKPTAAIVGGLVKSNFPARLVGSVPSADDARIAAGVSGSGAEKLAGRGDFLLVVKGDIQRIQAAYTPSDELGVAVAQIAAQPRPSVHALADAPQPITCAAISTLPAGVTHGSANHDGSEDTEPSDVAEGGAVASSLVEDEPQADPTAKAVDAPFIWQPINSYLRLGHHR